MVRLQSLLTAQSCARLLRIFDVVRESKLEAAAGYRRSTIVDLHLLDLLAQDLPMDVALRRSEAEAEGRHHSSTRQTIAGPFGASASWNNQQCLAFRAQRHLPRPTRTYGVADDQTLVCQDLGLASDRGWEEGV